MKNNSVIIIGGGISGLTAGIYLQKAGFNTTICEKNAVPGGQCMGWKRDGVYIDNCIHWLTDSKEGSDLNKLWNEIGMLGDNVQIYKKDKFFSYSDENGKITFWRDMERARREMLELSPDDKDNIERFFINSKKAENMTVPASKPIDKMGVRDYIKMGMSMKDIPSIMKEYKGMDVNALADSFKHPTLKKAFRMIIPGNYQAFAFIVSYATIASGNGDIPIGGSLAAALRIADRYKSLGGTLKLNSPADKVCISGTKAAGVRLEDGTELTADYVICATDINHTFTRLLPDKYMPEKIRMEFEDSRNYRTFSGFHVAFAIDGAHDIPEGCSFYKCNEFTVGHSKYSSFGINCFDYDRTISPDNKSVIQIQLMTDNDDYDFWSDIKNNPDEYKKAKHEAAMKLQNEIEMKFPDLSGRITLLDTWTPVTYNRYCNSYKGSYMSFVPGKDAKSITTPGVIKGLSNVFLAGQWLMGSGGLPSAAVMGRFAAWRIEKKEGLLR